MSHYLTHIDEANARVVALETLLGIAPGDFIENLDAANARIQELEGRQSAPPPAPVADASKELAALNQRCRHLANCLGFQEYGNCVDVPAAKARVADLEKRLHQQAQAHAAQQAPKKPETKPLPNDLAAVQKSGKVFGLGKAMIAAHHHQQQQRK